MWRVQAASALGFLEAEASSRCLRRTTESYEQETNVLRSRCARGDRVSAEGVE